MSSDGIEVEKAKAVERDAKLLAELHEAGLVKAPSLLEKLTIGNLKGGVLQSSALLGPDFDRKAAIRRTATELARIRGDALVLPPSLRDSSGEAHRICTDYLQNFLNEHARPGPDADEPVSTRFREMATRPSSSTRER